MDYDHLSTRLVRLHNSVRLADLDADRLNVEPASRCIRSDLLQGHIREGEARRTEEEDKTAEEGY